MASYNWSGDIIIHDTIVTGKRYVIGNPGKAIDTDIRQWIAYNDNNVVKSILRKTNCVKTKKPGDFDKRALAIWRYVNTHLRYVHDSVKETNREFWLFPEETITLRCGDCEDYSFLMASLLIASGISPYCIRVVLGEIYSLKGKPIGGHCWPMYKTETGEWCLLEMTDGQAPGYLPKRFINIYPFVRYVPTYCFNNNHLFRILPKAGVQAKKHQDLKSYFQDRGGKVNIKNTKLAPGGIFSSTVGHFDITAEVLQTNGFRDDAAHIAADASQDPDFYDFCTAAAHAQTENFQGQPTTATRQNAVKRYADWVLEHSKSIADPGNPGNGLFHLGYVLHAIQDLAAHEGITNEQHAYLAYVKNASPDEDKRRINKAKDLADQYVKKYKTKNKDCIEKLKVFESGSWDIYPKISSADKKKLLRKGWDLSPGKLLEYRMSSSKFDPQQQSIDKTRWNCNQVFSQLCSRL